MCIQMNHKKIRCTTVSESRETTDGQMKVNALPLGICAPTAMLTSQGPHSTGSQDAQYKQF